MSEGLCSLVEPLGESCSLAFLSSWRLLTFLPSSSVAVASLVFLILHHCDLEAHESALNVQSLTELLSLDYPQRISIMKSFGNIRS